MKSLFTAGSWASRRSARRVLAALLSAVGRAGLAAAADRPGLLAAVDQHTAAVRDALVPGPAAGRSTPPPALLAAYAEGVRDAAVEHGWQPPAGPVDWSAPDWVLTRLLAVCALAREAGVRP
ncbi:DUF6401 family natural product biosynthesis protein [Micromonospora zhanjiangensis]|uniref:DUF6401 family natural product biosynthesis protein n=1 Tax=Micromonospora zhanjiangensis TaxID=1522057 RepID=A0ABV8KSN1_9ACTN